MFFLLVAAVLGIFVFLFDGAAAMVGICFYGALFCAMFGISKGLFTIIDYNRDNKDKCQE